MHRFFIFLISFVETHQGNAKSFTSTTVSDAKDGEGGKSTVTNLVCLFVLPPRYPAHLILWTFAIF